MIHGICYRGGDGKFWTETFMSAVGGEESRCCASAAQRIAQRNALPLDGKVVPVQLVEAPPTFLCPRCLRQEDEARSQLCSCGARLCINCMIEHECGR